MVWALNGDTHGQPWATGEGGRFPRRPFRVTLPASLRAAERYEVMARMFDWRSGHCWAMPCLEWLMDECAEFAEAGKLPEWLAYYGNFAGLRKD